MFFALVVHHFKEQHPSCFFQGVTTNLYYRDGTPTESAENIRRPAIRQLALNKPTRHDLDCIHLPNPADRGGQSLQVRSAVGMLWRSPRLPQTPTTTQGTKHTTESRTRAQFFPPITCSHVMSTMKKELCILPERKLKAPS